jgi:hypothetical protein
MNKTRAALRLCEAALNSAKTKHGKYRVEEVRINSDGFSEPGYSGDVIASGNWNNITHWDEEKRTSVAEDDIPERLGNALEKIGVELIWGDEWTECCECNKLVRTSGDSYSWTRSYVETDDGAVCLHCVDPKEHLENLEGETNKCNTIDRIDPADHGYIRINEDKFEHGLYGGQSADPVLIGKALEKQGIYRYLFNLDSVGQFDAKFSVYIHKDEFETFNKEEFEKAPVDGEDPAEVMKRGLQAASKQMATLEGEGIKYVKVVGDQAEARLVSQEEFINGIKD